jgi:hypothetical protein
VLLLMVPLFRRMNALRLRALEQEA